MASTAATTQLPLPSLIRASAWDAGNSSMRAGGRTKWSRKDWNVSASTLERLVTAAYGEGPVGCIKFQLAEQLEKARILRIGMTFKQFVAAFDKAAEAA